MLIICLTVMLISCVYAVELVCDGACCLTATTPRCQLVYTVNMWCSSRKGGIKVKRVFLTRAHTGPVSVICMKAP